MAKSVRRSLDEGGHFIIPSFFTQTGESSTLKYVYLIQSIPYPDQRYVGITSDIEKRISAHNAGQSPHTSKFKPWKPVSYLAFSNTEKAMEFEKYLKTGSGRAFANRHFWS